MTNVRPIPAPPTTRTPPWDGSHATYAAIRDAVGTGPDGRPAFAAGCMLTGGTPGSARLWTGREWAEVPLGARVATNGTDRWADTTGDSHF